MSWLNTNSAISLFAASVVSLGAAAASPPDGLREKVLRQAALDAGLQRVSEVNAPYDEKKALAGEKLFEFEALSFNARISCRSCHLPQFSSADGLPNAVGVRGEGEGRARLMGGGRIVPRNAMPLWRRGAKGFEVFFWDGKVRKDPATGAVISQFGAAPPSDDPLVVAAHLPFAEFREMVDDERPDGLAFEKESVASANNLYEKLAVRIRDEPDIASSLTAAYGVGPDELTFAHATNAIAHFIRREFRLRDTAFHEFVFGSGRLTPEELRGGLLFYGKGRCAACHKGPLLTDFEFHAIPFPQAGFGKNGFGVDYGRYNVTFKPADFYRFRTPPLFNVEHTAPYSHSGSVANLEDAIRAHVDPLAIIDRARLDGHARQEFYRRMKASALEPATPESLDDRDIADLTKFLKTLSFCEPRKERYC